MCVFFIKYKPQCDWRGNLGYRTSFHLKQAAVQSLGTYTVSMCNKLALKASQLCHLIAFHSVLAVLTPYQSADDDYREEYACVCIHDVFHMSPIQLRGCVFCLASASENHKDSDSWHIWFPWLWQYGLRLYYTKALTPKHRWHQSKQTLYNRARSDKGECQKYSVKRKGDVSRWW